MKKFLIIALAFLLPVIAGAQAQIDTKKMKIADFTQKTTKVVMTGNLLFDAILKEGVASRWRISPYEFCSLDEFESLKTDSDYYFLIPTKGQFRKETEPGLMFLTLIKGGKKAEGGIDDMLEIVSIPIAPAEDSSGREFDMIPAFLNIIQNYTLDSMEKDYTAYVGLSTYSKNLKSAEGMKVVFAQNDLNKSVAEKCGSAYFNDLLTIGDEDLIREILAENKENTLVSYVVAPTNPKNGGFYYKMLIGAKTYELYMFRKQRINLRHGIGFMNYDIEYIYSSVSE